MSLKILIADDHRIVREGLASLLEGENDLTVIAEAGTGTEALKLAGECRPDVAVMDISMPDMNGIDATRAIVMQYPQTRVLALSMESDRRFVVEVLKAGAKGYVMKDAAFTELASAIRAVAQGELYLGPKTTEMVLMEYLQHEAGQGIVACEKLSPREKEILQLIAGGKSTKEIAYILSRSLKTVEKQRQSIMNKLDLYSIAELTKYAVREGLSSLT